MVLRRRLAYSNVVLRSARDAVLAQLGRIARNMTTSLYIARRAI
jgi:hypothetical protein